MIHNFKEYLFENDVFRYSEKLLSIKPKILYRQTASSLIATIDYNGSLCDKTVHIIIPRIEIDLKILLVILNSSLINYIYRLYTEENGRAFAQVKTVNVKKLPFIEPKDGSIFIEKADVMLSLNKELHDKTDTFLRFISSKYGIEKLSTKLQKFYDYDFATLLKELKGVKLSLNDQAELMEFFETKKSEIVSLKNRIDATDREIDEMVFELYGLTGEEREVVLDS